MWRLQHVSSRDHETMKIYATCGGASDCCKVSHMRETTHGREEHVMVFNNCGTLMEGGPSDGFWVPVGLIGSMYHVFWRHLCFELNEIEEGVHHNTCAALSRFPDQAANHIYEYLSELLFAAEYCIRRGTVCKQQVKSMRRYDVLKQERRWPIY